MNKYKPVIVASAFVIGLGMGYGVTSLFVNGTDSTATDGTYASGTSSIAQTTEIEKALNTESGATVDGREKEQSDSQDSSDCYIQVSSPVGDGSTYSFVVEIYNVPEGVKVQYDLLNQEKVVRSSESGKFSKIPGNETGSYTIRAIDKGTKNELARSIVVGCELKAQTVQTLANKMSAGEFQSILLNESDSSILGGKNPRVANSISFSFHGLRDDDTKPRDVVSIRERIALGIWKSASVVSVGYDNAGRINSAVISVGY